MVKTTVVTKVRREDSEEDINAVLERFLRAETRDLPGEILGTLITLTAMAHEYRVASGSFESYHLEKLALYGLIAVEADGTVVLPAV